MAISYKTLGRATPITAGTATALYTVPSATSAIVSSIVVCHYLAIAPGASGYYTLDYFTIWVRVGGAAASDSNKLITKATISAGDTIVLKLGITLGAGDVITVMTSNDQGQNTAYINYTAFGCEIT